MMSAKPEWITVDQQAGGLAVLYLHKEPVNTFSLDFWRAFHATICNLEDDPGTRALVIASGLKRSVFTAGNDFKEMYKPTQERWIEFFVAKNRCLSRLYASPLVTVAAIKGYCPAAGCAIAMCCDYRVATPNVVIGLNEAEMGIAVPTYWALLMSRIIGQANAERLCFFGSLIPANQAHKINLLDEVVQPEVLQQRAEAVARQSLRHPDLGRQVSKHHMKQQFADEWIQFVKDKEATGAYEQLQDPVIVTQLDRIMQKLSNKPQSKL